MGREVTIAKRVAKAWIDNHRMHTSFMKYVHPYVYQSMISKALWPPITAAARCRSLGGILSHAGRIRNEHVVNNYHFFHISNFVTEKMASSDAAAFVFVMRLDGKATGL